MILAGDVGGTKVNLALCEVTGTRVKARASRRFKSADFKNLEELLSAYLAAAADEIKIPLIRLKRQIKGGCLGVPGPVLGGKCVTVNLPWNIDAKVLMKKTGIRSLGLINDLEALGHGLKSLRPGKGMVTVRKGKALKGNQGLMAPGTGLGEAILFWDGKRHVVSPSEGGHCDFAPHNEETLELLKWLWKQNGHVSWEHVASGPSIPLIYRFLRDTEREKAPEDLETELAKPGIDASPLIGARALRGESTICVRTIDLWMYFVGAEAGNLVLKSLCRGGLFLGGGVIPHFLPLFERPAFFNGLSSKGRMSGVTHDIPVHVVTDPHAALYGAALAAMEKDF